MKFIHNGIILEPRNEFVIAQMQKSGYEIYVENAKDETEKEPVGIPAETPAETKEKKTPKKKKK